MHSFHFTQHTTANDLFARRERPISFPTSETEEAMMAVQAPSSSSVADRRKSIPPMMLEKEIVSFTTRKRGMHWPLYYVMFDNTNIISPTQKKKQSRDSTKVLKVEKHPHCPENSAWARIRGIPWNHINTKLRLNYLSRGRIRHKILMSMTFQFMWSSPQTRRQLVQQLFTWWEMASVTPMNSIKFVTTWATLSIHPCQTQKPGIRTQPQEIRRVIAHDHLLVILPVLPLGPPYVSLQQAPLIWMSSMMR